MRIAVGLPSLAAGDPLRNALDETFAELAGAGHEVEGFAEHDRTGETSSPGGATLPGAGDTLPFPVYHYLRMPERHAAAAFDAALYPLGRDASPYQGIYALMHRFPGVVWFLDPIVHHLAVGGIALMGDWVAYRELLDRAYGDSGAAVAQTVACNWGTGALFRRYDLVAATAATQQRVLAAWPALAARIDARLDAACPADSASDDAAATPVGVVEIPMLDREATAIDPGMHGDAGAAAVRADAAAPTPADSVGAGERRGKARRVAIMSVNESYATTAVRAAAAVLDGGDDTTVALCTSEPIYKAEARRVAGALGIHDRIDWHLTTDPQRLAEVAAAADVLVWLAEELQAGHRLLLLRGMAAGKLTVTPRCPLYDDLPDGAVAKLDPGRTVGAQLAGLLRALQDDEPLRRGLATAARSFAADQPTAAAAAARLADVLDATRRSFTLRQQPVSRRAWSAVRAGIVDAALPGGSSVELEQRVDRIVRSHTAGLGP